MSLFASLCASVCALALTVPPSPAEEARAHRNYRAGIGLSVAGALVALAGGPLIHGAVETDVERPRKGLYGAAMSSILVGTAMFSAGIVLLGRRQAYRLDHEGESPSAFFGKAAPYYLAASGVGASLVVLGSYAWVFDERPELGTAGAIVGANMMVFGSVIGGLGLGHRLYERHDDSTVSLGIGANGMTVSGRF